MKQIDSINLLGLVINLIALFIVLYFQFKDPQTGILFFFGVVGFIVLYFIVSYPINLIIKEIRQIDFNTHTISDIRKDLNNLKDKFNLRGEVSDLKSKMNLLEILINKKKRGQIDPRIIIIIIIIILLLLYLRSKGII